MLPRIIRESFPRPSDHLYIHLLFYIRMTDIESFAIPRYTAKDGLLNVTMALQEVTQDNGAQVMPGNLHC
jgi:hypothetical protein